MEGEEADPAPVLSVHPAPLPLKPNTLSTTNWPTLLCETPILLVDQNWYAPESLACALLIVSVGVCAPLIRPPLTTFCPLYFHRLVNGPVPLNPTLSVAVVPAYTWFVAGGAGVW